MLITQHDLKETIETASCSPKHAVRSVLRYNRALTKNL